MNFKQREEFWFKPLCDAFAAAGLPPELGPALARQESMFNPDARATDPRDLARGGSFGLLQMSYKTAQGLGYKGSPEGLMDPETNMRLAAELCRRNDGKEQDYELRVKNLAARYNSGKPYDKAPPSTKNVYAPNVLGFARAYQLRLQSA